MNENMATWTVTPIDQAAETAEAMQPSIRAIILFWHMLRGGGVPRVVAAGCTLVFCWHLYADAGQKGA